MQPLPGEPSVVLESRWRLVSGLRLHECAADAAGPEAPRLVLVHGLGVSGRYFLPLARRLASSARIHVPELPGSGRSEKPLRALDVQGLAAALAGWADASGGEPACFVGNSLGCQVVVQLAVARPELVDRVVLIGPTVDAGARGFARQLPRFLAIAVRERPRLVALAAREYLRFGPLRFAATVRYTLADRIETKLPHVRVPTLVIRGEHDALCPQPWAEQVAGLLPDGRLEVVAGKTHAVHDSAPDEVARLVRDFIGLSPRP